MCVRFGIGVCLLVVGMATNANSNESSGSTESVAWGYGPDDGPAVWGRLSGEYALCATGTRQSPIDLHAPTSTELPPVVFNYRPIGLQIANNGHTVEVASSGTNWIEVEGDRFELLQYHFHAPSEHTLAGRSFDMEIHLVHRNEEGSLAVVGIFVQQGDEHPVLGILAEHLPQPKQKKALQDTMIDASDLLPPERRVFHYKGSLTTPPCSEGVRWFVLEAPIEASDTALDAFKTVLGKNNRPVQALNERKLLINGDILGD